MSKLPFVWELKKDGVVSHAIGTLHECDRDYTPALDEITRSAERVLLEQKPGKLQMVLLAPCAVYHILQGMKIQWAPILDLLSQEEQEDVARMYRMPLQELRQKNIFSVEKPAGMKIEYAFELILMRLARQQRKPAYALERWSEQIQYYEETMLYKDPAKRAENLRRQLAVHRAYDPSMERSPIELLIDSLHNGNGNYLREIMNPETIKALAKRNKRMVQRSLSCLTRPTLIAVGATHLVVEPSLPTLYREHGIEVTRVH